MKPRLYLTTLLLLLGQICLGQKVPTISNIDFSLIGNKLVIKYNIDNSRYNDKYNIKVEIFKASGEKINAISFTGDLEQVQSIEDNEIIWDIERDNIELDDDIYVVISGEVLSEKDVDAIVETPRIITTPVTDAKVRIQPVSRADCFFKSLVYPGWGTSSITLKKAHLVKGILGYGAIFGSAYMAFLIKEDDRILRERWEPVVFESAQDRYTASVIFAGVAATIWSVDLITVLSVKNKTIGEPFAGISLNVGYSMAFNETQQFTCTIRF